MRVGRRLSSRCTGFDPAQMSASARRLPLAALRASGRDIPTGCALHTLHRVGSATRAKRIASRIETESGQPGCSWIGSSSDPCPASQLSNLDPPARRAVAGLCSRPISYESLGNARAIIGSGELKRVHPLGKLPAAIIDGRPLFESAAICAAIADLVPERRLIASPGDWCICTCTSSGCCSR